MNIGRRVGAVAAITALVILATPSLAQAALAITVPSTVSLGSASTGASSLSGQMGTITATASGLTLSWTASVSSTDFTTGSATTAETVVKSSISYWSGPTTAGSGLGVARTPGQLTALQAQSFVTPRTAFSAVSLVASSTSWNPTIVVAIPAAAVAGTYSGTITHSVA